MKVIVFKPQQSARARSLACSEKVSPTLWAAGCGFPSPAVCYDCTHNSEAYENVEVSPTLQARMGTGGNQVPLTIYDPDRRKGDYKEMEQSPTLVAKMGTGGGNVPLTVYRQGEFGNYKENDEGKAQTLTARGGPAGVGGSENLITFGKVARAKGKDGLGERWAEIKIASTRNCMDIGDSRAQEVVLMDQGGSQMSIEEGKTGTLRAQEHGHQPIICSEKAATLITRGGSRAGCSINASNIENMVVYEKSEHVSAVHQNQRNEVRLMNEMPALNTGGGKPGQGNPVIFENQCQVRRLTPTECERLMGFPDGYTNIKDNCPDSPRYKALGNSWAVPVVQWIGKRINAAVLDDCANDEVLKKEA